MGSPAPPAQDRAVVYRYKDGLYVNLTNKCPTACRFCIKFSWKMKYRGYDLRLNQREPSVGEILEAIESERARRSFEEVVFCGYGESTYRLGDMIVIAAEVRRRWPGVRRRLNTIGLGNLINGRSISGELAGHLDAVSISLNTADPRQWAELLRPLPEFEARGFASVQDFIRECSRAIPDTTVTGVQLPDVDLSACRGLVESLGGRWRERPYLDDYESS